MASPIYPADDLATWLVRSRTGTSDVNAALDQLLTAEHTYNYDYFATAAPPQSALPDGMADPSPPANPALETKPTRREDISDSLRTLIASLLARGWDSSNDVWFCRKVEHAAAEHSFESVVHSKLVGFKVPRCLVDANVAAYKQFQAAQLALREAFSASSAAQSSELCSEQQSQQDDVQLLDRPC